MPEHPNAAMFRKVIEGFNAKDESVADHFSDDIVWWQIGSPEPTRGKAAMTEAMAEMQNTDLDVQAEVHDVVANDDHVIGLVNATARAGDQEFKYRTAEILHVEDGKFTERWAFSDDTQAIIDFFGSLG